VNALYGLRITDQLFNLTFLHTHNRLLNVYYEVTFKKTPGTRDSRVIVSLTKFMMQPTMYVPIVFLNCVLIDYFTIHIMILIK
jgi:hypothetical protein